MRVKIVFERIGVSTMLWGTMLIGFMIFFTLIQFKIKKKNKYVIFTKIYFFSSRVNYEHFLLVSYVPR